MAETLVQAQDRALAAGADPQDIANVSQEMISVREESPININEYVPVGDEFDYDFVPNKAPRLGIEEVPEKAALELTGVVSTATGDTSPERLAELQQQISSGDFSAITELNTAINGVDKETALRVAQDIMIDPEVSAEDKQQVLLNVNARIAEIDKTTPNVEQRVLESLNADYTPTQPQAKDNAEFWRDHVDDYFKFTSNVQAIVSESSFDVGMNWETFKNVAPVFVTGYEGLAYRDFAAEFLDEKFASKGLIVPGEINEAFQQKLKSYVDKQDYEGATDFIVGASKYLKDNSGVFGGNDFMTLTMMLDGTEEILATTSPEDTDWTRIGLNFGGIVDAVPFLAGIVKGIKGLTSASKLNHLGKVVQANPKQAADLAQEAATTPEVAKLVGHTPESLRATYSLPKDAEFKEINTPKRVSDSIAAVDERGNELIAHAEDVEDFLTKGRESSRASEALREELNTVGDGKLWVADSTLERTEGGYRASAIVADNNDSGWATKEAADKANKELFDGSGEVIERRYHGEEWKTTDRVKDGKPVVRQERTEYSEYFIKKDHETKAAYMDDDFALPALLGDKANWGFDADSTFHKHWTTKANAAVDQSVYFEKELERYFDPVAKLPTKGQAAISRLLMSGRDREKVFSDREMKRYLKLYGIKGRRMTEALEAYREARRGYDVMYQLEDRVFRKNLVKDNFAHVTTKGFDGFGKKVDKPDNVRFVYNPATDKIEDAISSGEVIQLNRPVRIGDMETLYVKADDVEIKELPFNVLSYRKGYVPTMYKENYFIEETYKIRDATGELVDRKRVVNVASNIKEATKQIERLKSEKPNSSFIPRHDRNLSSEAFEQAMSDLNSQMGGLFFSKRGDRLRTVGDRMGQVDEPIEAGINAMRSVSKRVAIRPLVDDMKARWITTYGHMTNGVFPDEIAAIKQADVREKLEVQKAKSMFKYIQHLEGSTPEGITFRKTAMNTADVAESMKLNWFADGLRYMSDKAQPVSRIRATTFNITLATDTLRQLLLQPTQVLYTAPISSGNVVKQFDMGAKISKIARKNANKPFTNAEFTEMAKGMDMSGSEFKKLVKQFHESGLGSAVTRHELAKDTAKPLSTKLSGNAIEKTVAAARKPVDFGLGLTRKYGFERGEEINIGAHWMIARDRWIKNNPGRDPFAPDSSLEIAGEARAISLSMNRAGELAYQQGVASLPMQFFAVQHKAILGMLTNQQLTKAERRRIALGQLIQWGPSGVGMGGLAAWLASEFGVDTPDLIEDGLNETLVNSSLSWVSEEDVDLNIKDTFAPGSGIYDNILTMTLDGIKDGMWTPSEFLGPQKNTINRFDNMLRGVGWWLNTDDTAPYAELIQSVGKDEVVRLMSIHNRWTKARLMKAQGDWLDSHGRPLLPAGTIETIAFGAFGIQSNKIEAMYDVQNMISSKGFKVDDELTEAANDYYDLTLRLTAEMIDKVDAGMPYPEAIAQHHAKLAVHNKIINSYGADAEIIMTKVRKKVERNLAKSKKDELVDKMMGLYAKGDGLNAIEFAHSQGLITDDQFKTLQEVFNFAWGTED